MEVTSEPTVTAFLDLHSVDMSSANQEEITREIMLQMTNLGFLLLSNIPGYDEDALLKNQKWLFEQSADVKTRLYKHYFNKGNPNFYRGFAPFIENDPSHKELYEIGLDISQVSSEEQKFFLHEQNPWPMIEGVDEFRGFMTLHYDFMHKLGITIMSHIARGLLKPVDFFDSWFRKDTCSTLRMIHYLPRTIELVNQEKLSSDELKFTTPIHTDSGFLTLLSTFSYHGLQVNIGENEYRSVRPVPCTLVVNLGDMLSRITGYQLKATKHRVLDIGVERFSSPFFLEPHYASRIPSTLTGSSASENRDNEFVYGDWLIDKMRQFGEYKLF